MRTRIPFLIVAALFAALTFSIQTSAQADTFGTSGNEFTIDFVDIGNTSNAADTTGYGAVPYQYRVGTYEVSQYAMDKATASGMANVTAGAWTGNQPAANITWYEAAAFVNWLNTSTGKQAAYDLAWTGSAWNMNLWSSAQAWQVGGENLYRNKDAFYFLPSEDEWYKAAYYNPAGSDYFLYPTASNDAPTAVASGTTSGTAVYAFGANGPAPVTMAGGLGPYDTVGQGGNVWEWMETAWDGFNTNALLIRAWRGGAYTDQEYSLRTSSRSNDYPGDDNFILGLRVASVPEPSTYALLAMTAAGALWMTRRRR